MEPEEIRDRFIGYFVENNHLEIEDRGLLPPASDTSGLFINSGIHALKPYILGQEQPPQRRLTSDQSCIRTIDIDRVGENVRTLTYFRMLGSWSIGDYWKDEALAYAYELLTDRLALDPSTFAVTVFEGDGPIPPDEDSMRLWQDLGLKETQLYWKGAEDNLWTMGEEGPMGPCTEVYIDRGQHLGPDAVPGDESARFVEVWNAGVFMEYNRSADGKLERLQPRCIDTGAGLERLAVILQGKESVYDVEPLASIGAHVRHTFPDISPRSTAIVSDHLRASAHLLTQGIRPEKKGQGYVLRRLLRKAFLQMELAGEAGPEGIVECASQHLRAEGAAFEPAVMLGEHTQFTRQLRAARKPLRKLLRGANHLDGPEAFRLTDTHGLPLELLLELGATEGFTIDVEGYAEAAQRHRDRSRG